ncbi:hypothetical protein OH76DRAFT_1400057 [Lentinus brumalis]|uniref:Uncharacterized protein n=1 Tax=Lentinus brumalis TaxID=2498619 RepID=A0A371DJY4_9APHY|nr:hypothetical protein OH76DRAFT_1400057 [Polyporus brumalis]
MNFFRNVRAILGIVFLGSAVVFAQDELANSILTALRLGTDMSYAVQGFATRLSNSNMPVYGLQLVQVIDDIRDTFVMEVPILTNPETWKPFEDQEAEVILDNFIAFADVHRYLLQTLADKHSLAVSANFTWPILNALVGEQDAVDAFSYRLMALIPTREETGWQTINSLNDYYEQVEATYRS